MTKIAGAFNVYWGGTSSNEHVGQIADGITIEHFVNKRLITGDNEGLTPQDAVYQGHEVFVEFTLMEYDNARVQDMFWPYDTTTIGDQGAVGRLDVGSSLTKQLYMDHVAVGSESAGAGTTAASQPTTWSASNAILAEGFPVRMFYGPNDYRAVPLRMRLYPNSSGVFYAVT